MEYGKGAKTMKDLAASYGPGKQAGKPAFKAKSVGKPKKVKDMAAEAMRRMR